MPRIFFVLVFLGTCCCAGAQSSQNRTPIIFDSDMGPDYDDVGAIALLHAFADSGKIKILATVASTKYECVACVMNVFNTYFRRPATPIGVPKGDAITMRDQQHWTDSLLAKFPHQVQSNNEVPDAVDVYRKVLSGQPDRSVIIVTTGFLTNLSNLLKSRADRYSPFSGRDLIRKKVRKLVCMAGKFPSGREFNVDQDAPASQYVFSKWPTQILFSGFEIGEKIKTGLPLVHNKAVHHDPVKTVFEICIPKSAEDSAGRKSWDETAVLVAVKGVLPFYKLQYGHIEVAADGSNTWSNAGNQQAHLVEAMSPAAVEAYINKLMMHQPDE